MNNRDFQAASKLSSLEFGFPSSDFLRLSDFGPSDFSIGAVAGSRTRTCALAQRHSPLKSQPRKLEGRELFHSRPMPFQQRTNTSCYLAIPTHGFTVALLVFRGTPPEKPLNCKSVSNRLGARIRPAWTHHTGGTPRHSCDRFRLALSDIIKTSLSFHSQFRLPFALIVHCHIFRQQKTLLTFW